MKNLLLTFLTALCFVSASLALAEEAVFPSPDPAWAVGPEIPKKGYYLEEIGDRLYWLTDGKFQMMFLTTGKGVIVVDVPPSLTEKILAAVKETTDEPITHVIYSHSHADHIAGAGKLPKDASYIAHEEVAKQLAQERDYTFGSFIGGAEVPKPTVTFTDKYTLVVGDQVLELEYRGPTHSVGNIFIYAPKQKVLMLVDVIFPRWVPFKHLAIAEDVRAHINSYDWVLSYDFDVLVAGHMGHYGTREDVETLREYILDIKKNAVLALKTADFNNVAEKVGTDSFWYLIDAWHGSVSKNCADLTEQKWLGKLAGVDVFAQSHCEKVLESLRLD